MATYIMLFRLTQQGIQNIKESPSRIEKVKEVFKKIGVKVVNFYSVMGRYDTVFIVEAPDDKTAAKAALAVGSWGNVRTETLRAFTEDEYREIVASLP